MEGTGKPEYEKCVEISTAASIRQMVAPGALALLSPIVVGFAFGPEALGGLLAGITVSEIGRAPTLIKRPVLEHNEVLDVGFKADAYAAYFS